MWLPQVSRLVSEKSESEEDELDIGCHSPWITKGIAKSSKRKQKLLEKYLKRRTNYTETAYKLYKNLFESIKRRAKQNYYSEKLLRFKYNSKKHGQ